MKNVALLSLLIVLSACSENKASTLGNMYTAQDFNGRFYYKSSSCSAKLCPP